MRVNVVLLAAAARFLGKEGKLAAVHRAVQAQVPAALPDARAGGADGMGAALAAAAEAKVGIGVSVEHMWAVNNASIEAMKRHLAQTVAETTARLRAAVTNATGNTSAAPLPNVSTLVDPAAVVETALASNETVNRSATLRNKTANNSANMEKLHANWTYLEPRLLIRMENSSELSNFTHDYVHAIVDPHWGPRAVNATYNATVVVAEARAYSGAVDWQVQGALDQANSALHDGEEAGKAAADALRTAEKALRQAQDNTFKLKAAKQLASKAQDKAATSGNKAAAAVTTASR